MRKSVQLIIISLLLTGSLNAAEVAIVLDDWGYSGFPSRKVLIMPYPFTLAILPFAPNATEFALQAFKAGFEIILHLPLEPQENTRINSSYLTIDMNKEQIEKVIIANMLRLPGISGVNNHQGSLFTESEEKMTVLLKTLAHYNLFFFDSLTTSRSKAAAAGQNLGIRVLQRNVFLDNASTIEYINKQLRELFSLARKRGSATGIGHARTKTLEAMDNLLPELLMEYPDIQLVPLGTLVKKQQQF